MTTALVLQTQDNCPPGLVSGWARQRGLSLDLVRVDRWGRLPAPAGYELAVILGSDASVAPPARGWVARVLDWIVEADRDGIAILGICFGAQALAAALGGGVVRLDEPEQAWIEIRSHDEARVPGGPWLAVHQDAIVLPREAVGLAENARGVQAFAINHHLGVQFPEVTPGIVTRWVSEHPGSIDRALLVDLHTRCRTAAPAALGMFDAFLDTVVEEHPRVEVGRC